MQGAGGAGREASPSASEVLSSDLGEDYTF